MPTWPQAWEWFLPENFADFASIIGIFISIGGFFLALKRIRRSKEAADRAEQAVNEAVKTLQLVDSASNFANAIAMMEELKHIHMQAQWPRALERYSTLRKILISIRADTPELTEAHQTDIQAAISNLKDFESLVSRATQNKPGRAKPEKVNEVRMNELISHDVDKMYEIQLFLKREVRR